MIDVELERLAGDKFEMLREQGFVVCGLLLRKDLPTRVDCCSVSEQGKVVWHDALLTLGCAGADAVWDGGEI